MKQVARCEWYCKKCDESVFNFASEIGKREKDIDAEDWQKFEEGWRPDRY